MTTKKISSQINFHSMCLPCHCCRLANILNSMKSHHLSPMLNESEVSVFDDKPTGGTKCVRATSSYLCVHFLRSPDGEVSSVSVLFVCLQLFSAYHVLTFHASSTAWLTRHHHLGICFTPCHPFELSAANSKTLGRKSDLLASK